jgi:hypothetical protein
MISLQQLLALIIIIFLITRLINQKNKKQISGNEFALWLTFWIGSALAILFLKELDYLTARLGFTASGINLLFYAATLGLFYFIFRLRLRVAKLDRDLTDLTREMTLLKKKD